MGWKDHFRVNNHISDGRHPALQKPPSNAHKENIADRTNEAKDDFEMCSQIDRYDQDIPNNAPFHKLPERPPNAALPPAEPRTGALIAEEAGYILNEAGHMLTDHIAAEGESGRKGFNLWLFLTICWHSSSTMSKLVNVLWPVVPPAIVIHYASPKSHLAIFILNYIAMVPCANMIGFAGQELARKLPKVFGILVETTLGSVVEIVLFMVLLTRNEIDVIQAAALGSILATLLLCLGMCFFWGGMRRDEQEFSDAISEVGSGLLLTAGLALMVPAAFQHSLTGLIPAEDLSSRVLHISRVMSIILIIAYMLYVWFQMRSHNSIYDAIFEEDEQRDANRHRGVHKNKLTFTECLVALAIAIALVTFIAISLVEQISFIVQERGISDTFMGLILVPLVEKAAEHLTAVDEAWDDQMNLALAHVLGATIQTALFNTPLAVVVGWALNIKMDLDFEIFAIVTLILSILVVGNFLRDQKSTYLEGALCVLVYIIVAVAAFYFPNLGEGGSRVEVVAVVEGLGASHE